MHWAALRDRTELGHLLSPSLLYKRPLMCWQLAELSWPCVPAFPLSSLHSDLLQTFSRTEFPPES